MTLSLIRKNKYVKKLTNKLNLQSELILVSKLDDK